MLLDSLKKSKRILIVKLSAIGDVVMTTPVAEGLRKALPDAYIAWIVESKSKDVVINNPYLDEVIVWNRVTGNGNALKNISSSIFELKTLKDALHARKFDAAVDFQGLLRSALITSMSGAKYKIGSLSAREQAPLFYNVKLDTESNRYSGQQQYLRFLESLGIPSDGLHMQVPIDESDRQFAHDFVRKVTSDFTEYKAVISLCPATTWQQKHWTEDGWINLANLLISRYNLYPLFLGAKADADLVNRIKSKMSFIPVDAVGKTSIKQAAALIEQSIAVIAVDTGLLHVGTAMGRPSIGIFGPTRWRQLTCRPDFAAVAKELDCMPCMRRPTCTDFHCMSAITAEEVLAAANHWLNK